jgi:hypothetical protein
MKAIAAILIVLALILGIVPQFTDCLAQGRAIELANGKSLPMKCHWTRQAEIAVALPLLVVGVLMLFTRRRSTQRILAAVALVLGISAILIPAYLIGVCASAEMICNMLMRPILLFAGILIVATSLVALVYLRGEDPDAVNTGTEGQSP